MAIGNPVREALRRLESKTLEAQFKTTIEHGLNCSPFEAEAVLGVVQEVYYPFLDGSASSAPPGKVALVAVDADEPAGKPVAECEKRTVSLTVHRGTQDDRLMQTEGPAAYRQARIADLCQEALSQGALLTREDLAYRVFFVTARTITRDLTVLRQADSEALIPLRSTLHDIGPVLTHRVEIVRLALEGLTTTEICNRLRHSPSAVANYVSTFTRCAQLAQREMQVGQIAFLLRRSQKLVAQYLDLLHACETDRNRAYHLDELLALGHDSAQKNDIGSGGAHVG